MLHSFLLLIFLQAAILLPFGSGKRNDISEIRLTEIGQFGIIRKARPGIPAHYHTGIDIKRPGNNYDNAHIYPIAAGKIISKRTDGAYANLIIEHTINGQKIWSLYEHIAGVKVSVDDAVEVSTPIARFMNKEELNRRGWQFDHFHLEILKIKPLKLRPTAKNPERFYNSYSLICYTKEELNNYYYDPMLFLKRGL